MTRAVIYAPDLRELWILACHKDLHAHGEQLAGIAETLADAMAMVERGEADLIVVARPEHAPPVRVVERPGASSEDQLRR